MTIKEVLSLSPDERNAMNNAELKKTLSAANKAANRRLKSLKQSGEKSPAYKNAIQGGGKFKQKKTRGAMQKELRRAMSFLASKTSTVTGARRVKKDFEKRVGAKLTKKQTNKFWETYSKVTELHTESELQRYGSNQVQQLIAQQIKNGVTVDDVLSDVENKLDEEYERRESEYENNVDEFFEMVGEDF